MCGCGRTKQLERLQAYAKKQELEKHSLQKSAHDDKLSFVFSKMAKMSVSSFYKVWKDEAVKNRGRRLQIKRTLVSLMRRLRRLQVNGAWQGWWEQMLLGRKVDKVHALLRNHVFDWCISAWQTNGKMHKIGRSLMSAGKMQEGRNEDLQKVIWREWRQFTGYQGRLRKAMQLLVGDREGKSMNDFFRNWRALSACSLLKKAGFGARSKEKDKKGKHTGLARTASSSNSQSALGRKLSLDSGRAHVGRTTSPGISRTASFTSIIESDDDDEYSATKLARAQPDSRLGGRSFLRTPSNESKKSNASSAGNRSPLRGLARTASYASSVASQDSLASGTRESRRTGRAAYIAAQNSQDSVSDNSSLPCSPPTFGRTASSRSRGSVVSPTRSPLAGAARAASSLAGPATEQEKSVAREGISSEAFLSTLLKKGGVYEI